ncbi:MAG: HEAT repeat protein [bacterium ADurb.Bin374]|nr:MAG: HEAT repeat protein [bacterium ADurb.Bin374]
MTIDPVAALLEDLSSPDPTIRFSVLSRIEDVEWTAETLAAFKRRAATEADPGTRFQMQKLLARIERTAGTVSAGSEGALAELEALLKDPGRDDLSLAIVVEGIRRGDAPLAAIALREADWWNFSTELLPSILQFFKKFGSAEDVAQIETMCRHADPRVLTTAVEALEKLSPDSLKELIVPLLVNPVHGIRSRAIRLLYRWDPQEALNHFEAALFSEDANDRNAALFQAFFFPFPEIEPLMLRFIAIEDTPSLLEKAGFLFRANPAPEEPLRLLEVRENCRGEKRKIIGEILSGVIQSLHQAGLVQKTPDQLTLELEEVYQRRKARQLIEGCSLSLASQDAETRKQAALRLCDFARLGYQEARSCLSGWIGGEADADVRAAIHSRLAALDEKAAAAADLDLQKLQPEQRMRLLAGLDGERFKKLRPKLREFMRSCTPEERLLAVQTIGRVGDKSDAGLITGYLAGGEPPVAAAAIEALGSLDLDVLSPYLPKLIQHPADEVRAVAVRVFALFDKKQALSLVEKMFASIQPRQRAYAISCASQFDFPAVREMLISSLQREQDPENIGQYIAIFKANMDEDLWISVFRIVENTQGTRQEMLLALCREAAENLSSGGQPEKHFEFLKGKARTRFEAERAKKATAQPSYALSNIQKIRKQQAERAKEPNADPGLVSFAIVSVLVGAVATALIWFLFLAPPSVPPKKPAKTTETTAKPKFDKRPKNVSGNVTEVSADGKRFTLKTAGATGETYLIEIGAALAAPPSVGSEFNGQIKPVSKDGTGILAQLIMAY